MKKLLLALILMLLPLTAQAAKEVTIIDPYSRKPISARISDSEYTLMSTWNQQASQMNYPLVKPIPFKGTVGFEITNKAQYYALINHQNATIASITLYVNHNTTSVEVENYTQLLKRYSSSETRIIIKYLPVDSRSHQ